MKRWQVLTLAGLFVLAACVLLGALNLAMPLIIGPPTPTPTHSPRPTSTATVTPRPTPTLSAPTTTPTPYRDPYLACLEGVYDNLNGLVDQLKDASSDDTVLCNLVPAARNDMFDIRIQHARCPDPEDPTLSLLQFAYTMALQSGDSYLSDLDTYCDSGDSWSLDMANYDLGEMGHWLQEAAIQLADYASH